MIRIGAIRLVTDRQRDGSTKIPRLPDTGRLFAIFRLRNFAAGRFGARLRFLRAWESIRLHRYHRYRKVEQLLPDWAVGWFPFAPGRRHFDEVVQGPRASANAALGFPRFLHRE